MKIRQSQTSATYLLPDPGDPEWGDRWRYFWRVTLPVDAGAQWQTCTDACNTPMGLPRIAPFTCGHTLEKAINRSTTSGSNV
ncbi:hypothetical protein QT339_19910 [Escherichia coli]|nr:hypothetical protein [Escherichia coli]